MSEPPPPARVLVVQTSYLGDLVLATPVFAALKEHWPASHLTVLTRPAVGAVLRGQADVDEILTNDKHGRHSGLRGFFELVRLLRAGRFDVGIALHRGARTALLLALAEIPLRIGFRQAELGLLYHRRATRDPARHDVDRQLSILAPLGITPRSRAPHLGIDGEARRGVDGLLRLQGIGAERPYVAMAPGSAWPSKQWMPERYADVAATLLARGESVVYVGAPGEVETVETVRRLAGGGVSLAGATDAAGLVAAIARADAVVCNDSAPMHVAQALGVPVVVVVGPTSAAQGFMPRLEPCAIVTAEELTCRALCRHGGDPCPLGTRVCLTALGPERVLAELERVRAGARAAGAAESGAVC